MPATFSPLQLSRLPGNIRVQVAARLRRYRRPGVFWILTIGLSLLTANFVSRAAQPLPAQWGPSQRVVVLTRSVGPGQVVTGNDVTERLVPVAFVPVRSASNVSQVIGRRIDPTTRIAAPINLATALPASTSALSAAIGRNRRGVAIPVDRAPTGLGIGDLVDVLVNQDGDGALLATERAALVARVDDRQVLLSVTPTAAMTLSSAMTHGRPTLILVGG
jgi:Flp pilus assembly protein CpaB